MRKDRPRAHSPASTALVCRPRPNRVRHAQVAGPIGEINFPARHPTPIRQFLPTLADGVHRIAGLDRKRRNYVSASRCWRQPENDAPDRSIGRVFHADTQ